MPTYLYETVPDRGATAERFEIRQPMSDPPLDEHPVTGAAIRRVISGGLGPLTARTGNAPEPSGGCGPESCGCGRYG